jgi:hypothetical protein
MAPATDVLELYYFACNDGIPKGFRSTTRSKSVDELVMFVRKSNMRSTTAEAVCTDYKLIVPRDSTPKDTAATFIGELLYIYFNDCIEDANARLASDADANAAAAAIAKEKAADEAAKAADAADRAAEERVAAMVASFRASQANEQMVAADAGPKWYEYSDGDSDAEDDDYYTQ